MRYAAFILLGLIGIMGLIVFFQNLLLNDTYFSILFWTYRVTPAVPLFVGFMMGLLTMLMLMLVTKSKEGSDWNE